MNEISKSIRKRVFALFLMFLILQTLACGREEMLVLSSDSETETVDLDSETEILTDGVDLETESLATQDAFVYICGAVKYPGVYKLKASERVCDVLDMAGGFLDDAKIGSVNLAETITDGEMVYIPFEGEDEVDASLTTEPSDGRININSAGVNELITLSGIGETKAKSIVDYRQNNGAFASIEDIMKVSGIGEGCFNKIKDNIKVE